MVKKVAAPGAGPSDSPGPVLSKNGSVTCLLLFLVLGWTGIATGQDLEPRFFSQTPVGMNFAVLATGYSEGNILFDQATTLEDVTGDLTSLAGAYVRTLDFFGVSGKVAAVVPVIWGDWEGRYQGEHASASRRGLADPTVELTVNFLGAPAMTMREMRGYSQKWVVGGSLKVGIPLGQYYADKLINLGTNRWAFRPRFGISRKSGPLTLEAMGSAWLFTDNSDFLGGALLEQGPLYSLQFSGVYQWPSRIWLGVGAGFSRGGKTRTNGIAADTYKKNTRWTFVLSLPVNKYNSVKLMYTNGLHTRAGSDFDTYSLAWSLRWGGEN